MSPNPKPKKRRHPLDYYPSTDWAAKVLYRRVAIDGLCEPCVGEGDLIKDRTDVRWTNDVDKKRDATYHLNAAAASAWGDTFPRVPWVVTNPPFRWAHPILLNAFHHATVGVAFLLRISFLEPALKRAHFLTRHPPTRVIVMPRISFTRDGKTDNVTCSWLIWGLVPGAVEPGVEIAHPRERSVT